MDPRKDANRYYYLNAWIDATVKCIDEDPLFYQGYEGLDRLKKDLQKGLDSAEAFNE